MCPLNLRFAAVLLAGASLLVTSLPARGDHPAERLPRVALAEHQVPLHDPARHVTTVAPSVDTMTYEQLLEALRRDLVNGTNYTGLGAPDVDPPPRATNDAGNGNGRDRPRPNQQAIEEGRAAFNAYCVDCHDANRSLSKARSQSAWMGTIRRMATKEGASIPASSFAPIATYLAQEAAAGGDGADVAAESEASDSAVSVSGTVSPLWLGGNDGNYSATSRTSLRNPGFFPDAWVTASWHHGPVSARVTACTSCHDEPRAATAASQGMALDLVDASLTIDLVECLAGKGHCCETRASLEVGRFIVPFGAFAGMSHPGVYRTVTNPLMFLMGRTAGGFGLTSPVLPAPYCDEGANLKFSSPVWNDVQLGGNVYVVNGLQEGPFGASFLNSRNFWDNNNDPAIGSRLTLGNQNLRVGASYMTGHFHNDYALSEFYRFWGADLTAKLGERMRFYFEYALRTESEATPPIGQSQYFGTVSEAEFWVTERVSLLARYDTLDRRGVAGYSEVNRWTAGLNIALPGATVLMLNYENWVFPTVSQNVDVVGFRWMGSF